MPTARELLEQADALMRRNRQQAAREVPPPLAPLPPDLHPASSPIDAPQRSGQQPTAPPDDAPLRPELHPASPPIDAPLPSEPHPAAPSIEPDPQVVDPLTAMRSDGAAESVPPAVESPRATATDAADDADIPLLEDEVGAVDDDVPLLTDAIDEIEVGAPAIDEGDPSDWLVESTGEQSVLGPSPPSVVRVPAAVPDVPPPIVSPADPTAGVSPRKDPLAGLEAFPPEPDDPDVTVRGPVPVVAASDTDEHPQRTALDAGMSLREDSGAGDGAPVFVPPETTIDVPARHPDSGTKVSADDASGIAADTGADIDAWSPPPPSEPAIAPLSPSPPQFLPVGAEREALAEEIRMQVLQRIDMFTDTGLRERLGERLKPIVDRASADLVDAINQHVGEILRAYVAEAIEREIDRWRAGR